MASSEFPTDVTVAEAHQLLQDRPGAVRLLDVREADELAICRVPGACEIPMRQIPEQLSTLPRDQHLLVMCHHGGRSARVVQYLKAQGFTAVSNVAGGIDAWAEQIDPELARY